MDEILKDERFSHILTDPRFRRIPKNVRKIKVDNRFKEMFKNKKFAEKCRVDERGRTLNLAPAENLKKLYNMDEESSESEEEVDKIKLQKSEKKTKCNKSDKIKKHKKTLIPVSNKSERKNLADSSSDSDSSENILDKQHSPGNSSKDNKSGKSLKDSDFNLNRKYNSKKNHKSVPKSLKHTIKNKNSSNCKELLEGHYSELSSGKNKNSLEKKEKNIKMDTRFLQKCESEDGNSSENCEEDDKDLSEDQSTALTNIRTKEENESEIESSSNSEESDDSDSDGSTGNKSDSFDHQWEEHHERAPDTEEITKRLAVCNMDWDRIRAVDLYAVFNSFKPPDTSILSVKIFPSEFGLKRMEEEKLKGPPELVEKTLASDEEEEASDIKGGKYHREKLRQYQMNRLKYYYAILECDTPETANSLYEQLNGMEYESSSVRFDLRFVPDDMTFDQEPTSIADNIPDLTEYKPRLFVTTALQQVKVGLTWDETDHQRRETLQKAFTEPDNIETDIKEYLASSSGESEEEISDREEGGIKLTTKERIQKYKELLESINKQEAEKSADKYEMEITWEPGAKEKTENLVKEKLEEKSYTPFEELQKKKREKQKLKKKEKKNINQKDDSESSGSESDSDVSKEMETKNQVKKMDSKKTDELCLISDAKKIDETQISKKKKKKKAQKEIVDDFKVDVNDPRFSAIYTSPLFNIDPSDPHFKSTPGNLAIIAEKQRRLKNKANLEEEKTSNKKFKYS